MFIRNAVAVCTILASFSSFAQPSDDQGEQLAQPCDVIAIKDDANKMFLVAALVNLHVPAEAADDAQLITLHGRVTNVKKNRKGEVQSLTFRKEGSTKSGRVDVVVNSCSDKLLTWIHPALNALPTYDKPVKIDVYVNGSQLTLKSVALPIGKKK